MKGIDVSTYQGYPAWDRVAADGVEFAMIKATQGKAESSSAYLFVDSKFHYNIESATSAGIRCGVYHYLTAKSADECEREALFFLQTIEPFRDRIELWAAVDVESRHLEGMGKAELSAIVMQFCDIVRDAGYAPMVYTNPDWLRNRLAGIGDADLWLALWRDRENIPTGYPRLKIWQWGADYVDGINGEVDSNIGLFDVDQYPSVDETVDNSVDNSVYEMDNTPSDWAADAVQWAVDNGIMYGDENGNYRLRDACTREMMLVFLYRALGGGQ